MKTIKFRGYAVDEMVGSQWLVGTGIDKVEVSEDGGYCDFYLFTESGWVKVYEESVGQFIGMCDKNGNEICEGHILEYKDYSKPLYVGAPQPKTREVVKYSFRGYGEGLYGLSFLTRDAVEIVGDAFKVPD